MTEVPADVAGWRRLRGGDLIEAFLVSRWYAMPNDAIGGWCVMPTRERPSQGGPEVGAFMAQAVAEHVAELHNAFLDGQLSGL